MYLSAYVTEVADRGGINSSLLSPVMTTIMELQKAMSDLDKIATTPIPSAYSFHLRLTVWAYLFFLPFQLYNYIQWVTIPATAIAAIIYLGFLEIGAQIEIPFGYDQTDLDLDRFVLKISQQLAEVTAVRSCYGAETRSRAVPDSSSNSKRRPVASESAIPPIPVPVSHATTRNSRASCCTLYRWLRGRFRSRQAGYGPTSWEP
jgi:hypothetical protein